MRFESVHPTDVPNEQAELVFLALASKWSGVNKDELAAAFMKASIYPNRLPETFGMNLSASVTGAKFGVLISGVSAEGFRVRVSDHQRINIMVVAACDVTSLATLWDDPRARYQPDESVPVRQAEVDYEKKHGESHLETLRRVAEVHGG